MKTNKKGIELIKQWEGTGPMKNGLCQPYLCSAGYWTIGYGNRWLLTNECVTAASSAISLKEAEYLMCAHIEQMEKEIDQVLTNKELTANQYSAVACWVYNLGIARLKSSTLLKKLNNKDLAGAADEFLKWNKETKKGVLVVSKGLNSRRIAERNLFLLS